MNDVAGTVSAFMEKHALSQVQLAEHLGVSQSAVSRWLLGRRPRTPIRLLERALRDLDRELARPTPTEMDTWTLRCTNSHGPLYAVIRPRGVGFAPPPAAVLAYAEHSRQSPECRMYRWWVSATGLPNDLRPTGHLFSAAERE